MSGSLLALALCTGPAIAQPVPDEGATPSDAPAPAEVEPTDDAEPPPPPTAKERLDVAIRFYQTSRRDDALRVLAALVNDPDVTDMGVRQEARFYLGEVLYYEGDKEGASQVFERILADDRSYQPDLFRHPPDVVGWFGIVRARMAPPPLVAPPVPVDPPVPRHLPVSVFAGFGIYQLANGRTGRGSLMLIGGAGAGVANILTFTSLARDHHWDAHGVPESETEAEQQRLLQNRWINWTSLAAFWGLYSWGAIDATQHWKLQLAHDAVGVRGTF